MSSAGAGRLGGLVSLAGLGGWLLLFNLIALVVWGHGPLVFVGLLVAALGFWAWPSARRRLNGPVESAPASERFRRRLLVGLLLVVLTTQAHQVVLGFDDESGFLVDIALNTDCAVTAWLAGENPWATRCQLWHEVPTTEGVEVTADGAVFLHGWRYHYGYPYFPAMIATYLPMRLVVDGPEAVRWTNLVLVLAHLVLMSVILYRLLPAVDRRLGILVAMVAFLGVGRFGRELFEYAVTDIAISFWALCGVLACWHRRFVVGGALFGIASACKLLPGPFLVAPLALALFVRGERRSALRLAVAWVVTTAAVVLPAVLADPESFVTATILFYRTVHAVGDDTSLWFFLPAHGRPLLIIEED
ncbi:MAG: glycosyltransferase 87 family protein [Acidobacteriota bacterium]